MSDLEWYQKMIDGPPRDEPAVPALTAADLIPGHLYRVEFQDCCVNGFFVGTFIEIRMIDEDDGPYQDAVVFDCGEINNTAWTVTEILPGQDGNPADCADCEHGNAQHHSGGCAACTCSMPPT